ncbi:MAG: bifunctional enoyl-CoA hydratase/phosphate acetyltransferase [Pseudomonadota bacterium]
MSSQSPVTCPPWLLEKASENPPLRTAIVNAGTALVMESVRDAAEAGLINPILFGDKRDIERIAGEIGWDLADIDIIQASSEGEAASAAAFAAGAGEVGALMKGHVHTDTYLRAILKKEANLRTGRRLTHLFMMSLPGRDGPFFISDAALNAHPDEITLQTIIANVVDTAHAMGITKPKIALLSATETPSDAVPSSVQAASLSDWSKSAISDADVSGPLAFDLAVSPDAAKIKGVSDPVAGQADAIIVPDIVSGNALFKSMVHFNSACAAGLVVGARVPVLLTSRADPPAARLASAALASIVARGAEVR